VQIVLGMVNSLQDLYSSTLMKVTTVRTPLYLHHKESTLKLPISKPSGHVFSTKNTTHLPIRHIGSWWRLCSRGWREYMKASISRRSHNLILTVQPVVAQFWNPGIKWILGLDLETNSLSRKHSKHYLSAHLLQFYLFPLQMKRE